ncbi:MAG: DUF167 domain-containing protein [Clostridiales bacterium]|jgi:uncharacterized protein (TIGR00251 family)|nr:DUF167 domain-containing protein [Clostridiales bacterium]
MSREVFQVKVIPNAGRTTLEKTDAGYKARLTAPPVDGKANEALIELLSKEFGVPKRNIEIIKGATSRNKTVEIRGAEQ